MAKLILKYEASVLKEIPLQKAAISIGRTPGNDVVIDNLAVSGAPCQSCIGAGVLCGGRHEQPERHVRYAFFFLILDLLRFAESPQLPLPHGGATL